MNGVTWIHVAAGVVALVSGAIALSVRKGGRLHTRVGMAFCVAMLALGITAAMLLPFKSPPESPVGGILVCYFVATAWLAARRRDAAPARLEQLACAIILLLAVAIVAAGFERALAPAGKFAAPPPAAVLFALGGVCLLAGLADLRYLRRGTLRPAQRIVRHLWRMSFAFFIATGSFFIGQQDLLPAALRGSPLLVVLGVAPLPLMLYWMLRARHVATTATSTGAGQVRLTD